MDRKSIIVVAACVVMLGLWYLVIVPKYLPNKPPPPGATNTVQAAQSPALTNGTGTNIAPASAISTPSAPLEMPVSINAPEQLLVVTNEEARYTFTSYGGGLKLIDLVKYPETVPSHSEKIKQASGVATLNTYTPAPTLAVLGDADLMGDGIFALSRTATGVRAEKTLPSGLTLVKEFSLGSNYLLNAAARIENHSDHPVSLSAQQWIVGTATPMNKQDKGAMYIGVMWSDGEKARDTLGASYFSKSGFACTPRVPPAEFRAGQTNVAWAAVHNQFFALAVVPQDKASEIVMRPVDMPWTADGDEPLAFSNGYTAALVYPATTLTTNQTLQHQFVIYAGPKEYKTLAGVAAQLNNNLDAIMNFGFFGFFAKALLLGMNLVHSVLRIQYGLTIVAITIFIKLVFWPLTAASTRSMKRMQALQPQIKAIQAKYKDDPMKAQKKQMELFKENKVNPMGGCLPMVIQMPVFIGFFTMIRSAIELRGQGFLWITDLSRPDTLFVIPGTHIPFNLLPLIMGATMLWQTHLAPPSPGVDPAQQKMMRYMPLIFLVFLYNYSAGMALYWTTNNLLTIAQTKFTKAKQDAPATPVLTSPPKKKK
jgi:YidC/Oxa1 family membrane protein insertase